MSKKVVSGFEHAIDQYLAEMTGDFSIVNSQRPRTYSEERKIRQDKVKQFMSRIETR